MLDLLAIFIKVVKAGNFSEATKTTSTSSPNLTRKIQKLEALLGFSVLKRDTRTIELSSAGRVLFDKFCNIETDLEKTITGIEKGKNEISGLINVLLPPFFALKIITPYLVDFLIKYPKISLNITYQNRETNLIKDDFDLAIINHRPQKNTQKMKLLCRSKIIFYCYPEYITKFGLPHTQEQLEKSLIMGVMLDQGIADKTVYLINKITGQKRLFNHNHYRIIQHSGAHDQELAQSGAIIGAGMDILLQKDIDAGVITQILPDYYIAGFEYYLLINPEGKNARTEAFIEFINECLQRLNLESSVGND